MAELELVSNTKIAYCFNCKSIPYFLHKNVKKEGDLVTCISIDDEKKVPIMQTGEPGRVIAYIRDIENITGTGWICWFLDPEFVGKNLEFKNGVYYKI